MQEPIKMNANETQKIIVDTLLDKGGLKQDVFSHIKEVFGWVKTEVKTLVETLTEQVKQQDKRIEIRFKEINSSEFHLFLAGDVLVFHMHSNIFKFDSSHPILSTGYLKEDDSRAYCGMIYVYNFLADSLKYKRHNDLGYLVGRMFVNKDFHYFMEGKRQLGFLYNNFSSEVLTQQKIKEVLMSAILFTLDFDLFMPPYQEMSQLSVYQLNEMREYNSVKTGKRLGFQFKADDDKI